jgi:hypothetical protein
MRVGYARALRKYRRRDDAAFLVAEQRDVR